MDENQVEAVGQIFDAIDVLKQANCCKTKCNGCDLQRCISDAKAELVGLLAE